MTHFNSTDTAGSKDTDTRGTETAETGERRSGGGGGQRADGDSTYRVRDGESVMAAVVRAVGSETRTDPTELRPLHATIDTDALNGLFSAPNGVTARTGGHIAFDYCERQVRVEADGTIKIDRPG